MITAGQRRKFFPLEHRAWLTHAARIGQFGVHIDRAQEDAWYRQEMHELLGVDSVKDLHPVEDFDRIMLHWAQIIGDDREIHYWTTAQERRMKRRIRIAMQQLADLQGCTVSWGYVRSIQYHMNIPEQIDECPVELLHKVYQALDTQVRRLKRKHTADAQVPF